MKKLAADEFSHYRPAVLYLLLGVGLTKTWTDTCSDCLHPRFKQIWMKVLLHGGPDPLKSPHLHQDHRNTHMHRLEIKDGCRLHG